MTETEALELAKSHLHAYITRVNAILRTLPDKTTRDKVALAVALNAEVIFRVSVESFIPRCDKPEELRRFREAYYEQRKLEIMAEPKIGPQAN